MAMQQLLCRHAAIALSRCSNELPSRNRATERIKKAVISLLSGKSPEPKVDDSQGAKDHRRGGHPPGQDDLTIISPERASEFITCLVTTCLWLCRPFRTFSVVATLPGVVTPVCGLSSLRDFWQVHISCYSSETPIREDLKGRERNFPRTAIIPNPFRAP